MSDKSYQIKENNQVMIQGGEKKVMKKILSVALSTAMAFSMFASVAFGDDALNTQQKFDVLKEKGIFTGYPDGTAGLDKEMTRAEFAKVLVGIMGLEPIQGKASFKDKNYKADKWPAPYVEAVYAAGIMEGKNTTKMIFDFNGKITVQEMAKVLVTAQKLDVPTETNNNASDWAKGYVQAAINAGLVDAKTNPKANASRSQLVEVAYTIYLSQQKPKVVSYDVKEDGKVVEFKLADNEIVKVTLDTPLKANVATDVKFTHKNQEYTHSVTWVVESATKVQSATSTNLKEVDVVFDGKVDRASATDKNNYVIDSNSKGIKSISVLEDGKSVRILLNESSKFVQGTTYKIVVKNVKGDKGATIPQGEVSFSSSDNTLPTVSEVKGLGTKVIKVTFSEPTVAPTSSNFQLDDKAFVGSVTQGENKREVILRNYTGDLSVGTHKLTASLVEDYAGLKSLADTKEFTVAVDTEGPKVTDLSATLEKVTVTFDEEIDPDSVKEESFYWKSGDSKKKGKATQIAANVYEIDFTDNRLPGYETSLFIDVKDYSGNANAVKEHKVTASVDLTRPHVLEATYGVERNDALTVRFDKAVKAADIKYYTVKKGDKTISVKQVVPADSSNKIFNVYFYNNLEAGTYSLKIKDVEDMTALRNVMDEYNGSFEAIDVTSPSISKIDYNQTNRKVALHFGREMDLSKVREKGNYYIEFTKNGGTTQRIALPNEVTVDAVNNGKSVVLQFPEYINGTKVTFGPNGSVSKVLAFGLTSKTGQVVNWDPVSLGQNNELRLLGAKQTDAKTVELEFNQVIARASVGDFLINGSYPSTVTYDENKVTLKANSDITGGGVTLFANNSIETYSNNKTNYANNVDMTLNITAAPRVTGVSTRDVDKFTVTFSTYVQSKYEATGTDMRNDLEIKDLSTNKLIAVGDYSTKNDDGKVEVTLDSKYRNVPVSVKVKENAQYIIARDTRTAAAKSDEFRVEASTQAPNGVAITSASYNKETGFVTVTLDKNVANVTNVHIGGVDYSAKTVFTANTSAFTVDVGKDNDVAGHYLTANVTYNNTTTNLNTYVNSAK
ncbi:S-layer homology domain-containing protein [Paenibacillus sp. EZ-K15]|uniref:S-layer homology domain-containing protein n=1 Tax=Paenibacillus sp. EZ-K15 TaxID=2044275 RepID=UPI000BF8937B|nr:S-layer homology domain-containing protein [Paenibacillus sp. EZ-K15]